MSGPSGAEPLHWEGRAPAKVNLSLVVLAREEGGFHQIETVFQALELADRVELSIAEEGEDELQLLGVTEGELGPSGDNLAIRAARGFRGALRERGSEVPGVRIRLEKRIPHGAGLGGGSSDAAAVLRGLDALCGGPLGNDELMRIGGALGSDVPFFVSGCSRALAWGRGDRILPLSPLPRVPVLLAVPSEKVPTPWAYGELARRRAEWGAEWGGETRGGRGREGPGIVVVGQDAEWDAVAASARNAFEEVLFPVRPELAGLRRILNEAGARPSLLSGSGAAVFGVFRNEEDLDQGEGALRKAFPGVQVIRTYTHG